MKQKKLSAWFPSASQGKKSLKRTGMHFKARQRTNIYGYVSCSGEKKLGFSVRRCQRGILEMGGEVVTFEFCVYVQWDVNNHSALINKVGRNFTRQLETE